MKKIGHIFSIYELEADYLTYVKKKLGRLNIPYTICGKILWVNEDVVNKLSTLNTNNYEYYLVTFRGGKMLKHTFFEITKKDIIEFGDMKELRKNNIKHLLHTTMKK